MRRWDNSRVDNILMETRIIHMVHLLDSLVKTVLN